MTTEGKVWGKTTEIYRSETVSAHVLEILAGGFSSKHRHKIKKNIFHVLAGTVKITTWIDGHADETILRDG
ncbi:MAG: hypothetical protein IMZ71_05635 [Chloroflexi bacterium]|nr:hypothetical protein [Chloroflexota bacterium]